MRRHASALLALALVLAAATACAPGGARLPARGQGPVIRALLEEGTGPARITVSGPFDVRSGGAVLLNAHKTATVAVERRDQSLQARLEPDGAVGVGGAWLQIVPKGSAQASYDGVPYAGRIDVRARSGSERILVINVVDMESYLEGVVPHEIGDPGPDAYAAVEAQAVAARTYAITRIDERRGEPFDVFAGVQDQVYRGRARIERAASAAVRETRGVILTYHGHPARAYYCANCGGHTADIERVWPQRESAPYLRGVLDSDGDGSPSFCANGRHFRWRYSFTGKELGTIVRRTLPRELGVPAGGVGSLVDLRVTGRGVSGRARALQVVTTTGTYTVAGDRIRWVLAPDPEAGKILPSTMFTLYKTMRGGNVAFVSIAGGGNGHGVGMCQSGAVGMARRGYSYRMILSHYYPGASLSRRY